MEDTLVKKKRIRKKTCEIDTLEKLKSDTRINVAESKSKTNSTKTNSTKTNSTKTNSTKTNSTKTKSKKDENENEAEDTSQVKTIPVSFGKFNLIVKKKPQLSQVELRSYYDTKFKIDDSEKTAKLMIQEDDNNMTFEPMMEDNTYVTKQTENNTNTKILEKTKAKIERTNVHKILSKFIDGVKIQWPEKTDIMCWWCCHTFDTIPIPCPVEYDEIRNRYKVNGIFCSWSCSAAYSIKEYSSLALIYQMKNDLCGYSENIVVAPPKYCLKNFGGYMTIKDYRALDKTKTLLISTEGLSYINLDIAEMRTG